MNDPLDELVVAYRAVAARDRGAPDATRARILGEVDARRDRRRWLAAAAVLVAIALTNGTVWAYYTGRLDPMLRAVERVFATPASSPPAEPAASAPLSTTETPASEAEATPTPETETETEVEVEVEAEPVAGPRRAPRRRAAAPPAPVEATAPPVGAPAPVDDPLAAERAAFTAAQRLHFGGAPPTDALRAWDRFLAAHPVSRFEPEAYYNRAILLVRLGRHEEARYALRRIANGVYGEGHRADARRLLRALDEGRVRTP